MISVVIPTRDRALRLAGLVASFERQDIGLPFEVIVVDDGSRDGTGAELQRLAENGGVRLRPVVLERNAGPATARNRGWRAASAPFVVFTDDDCLPRPGWLRTMVAALESNDLVQGRTEPDPDELARAGPFSRTVSVGGENGFYETCNMGYRRDALERLGGFDEAFRLAAGEDTDLGCRAREAGLRFRFEPDAVVRHDVVDMGFLGFIRNGRRWSGVYRAVRLHPALRRFFSRGPFWLHAHYLASLAVVGAVAALAVWTLPVSVIVAVAALLPYVAHRSFVRPLPGSAWQRIFTLPAALVADSFEAITHIRCALRYR